MAPHFKSGKRHFVELPTRADAIGFIDKFRAKPFTYNLPASGGSIRLRVGWPAAIEQPTHGRHLGPLYSALDVGPFAGNLRMESPRDLAVGRSRRCSLEELLRVSYAGDPDHEKIVRIGAGAELFEAPRLFCRRSRPSRKRRT